MIIKKKWNLALAGNPNSGKTTIFNNLTGSNQHVGNYPGVTVEHKEGILKCKIPKDKVPSESNPSLKEEVLFHITDLPGIYTLNASSPDEEVARKFLTTEEIDFIINIIDASNIERNLNLTIELLHLKRPIIIILNMMDQAKALSIKVDVDKLSKKLSLPIVTMVGNKGKGIDSFIEFLLKKIGESDSLSSCLSSLNVEGATGKDEQSIRKRVDLIRSLTDDCLDYSKLKEKTLSDRIDHFLLHPILGPALFLLTMYFIFFVTFKVGAPLMDLIEGLFSFTGEKINLLFDDESLLRSLLVDGVIGGVGGVLVFLPNIVLLFLGISILEDSGYMARAAFMLDRIMRKIGLPGKSFIPMLLGFGCSVPAIMATRVLEKERDRLITMLVIPLISCGARLPIYTLLIPAFFPDKFQAPLLWGIYLLGIFLAIFSAKVLGMTLLKGKSDAIFIELPPYRLPTLKTTLLHMWNRAFLYLKKAGTIILLISIILWFLSVFPKVTSYTKNYDELTASLEKEKQEMEKNHSTQSLEDLNLQLDTLKSDKKGEELSASFVGQLGKLMEPLIAPLGFDWKIGTALIGALAAKEVFVAQMGIVYRVGDASSESTTLRSKLAATYSPLVGLCIMVFSLISAPCMSTIAITKRESNSLAWALFQFISLSMMAYLITFVIYQVGIRIA